MNNRIYYNDRNKIKNNNLNSYEMIYRSPNMISKPRLNIYNNNNFNNYSNSYNKIYKSDINNRKRLNYNIQTSPLASNIKNEMKIMNIQERFDELQNKINYLKSNVIKNKDLSNRIKQTNNINTNFYNYQRKYNSAYSNKNRFNPNINYTHNNKITFNPNNTFNNLYNKKLNEINKQMQNSNSKSSLIKRITSYRTMNIPNNKNNNYLSNTKGLGIHQSSAKNINYPYKNITYNNKTNYNYIKNVNNIKKNNHINDNNYNYNNSKKLVKRGYPNEIDEIKYLEDDDLDVYNKTFNLGNNYKLKDEFILDYNNNNKTLPKKQIITLNLGNKTEKLINKDFNNGGFKNKIKSYSPLNNKNFSINNYSENYNYNNYSNGKNNYLNDINRINNEDDDDDDISDNLSDIADELVDTFQVKNLSGNIKNSSSDSNNKKFKNNSNIFTKKNISNFSYNDNQQINYNKNLEKKPITNKINDLDKIEIKKSNKNNNIKNQNLNLPKNGRKVKRTNDLYNSSIISPKNKLNDNFKINNNDNYNLNNKNTENIKNKNIFNINNINYNNIINNNKLTHSYNKENNIKENNNDQNKVNINMKNNKKLMDKKDLIHNINNVNIMQSLIIINNKEEKDNNGNNNKKPSLQDNNMNEKILKDNILKESTNSNKGKLNNSNIIFNLSFSNECQFNKDANKIEKNENIYLSNNTNNMNNDKNLEKKFSSSIMSDSNEKMKKMSTTSPSTTNENENRDNKEMNNSIRQSTSEGQDSIIRKIIQETEKKEKEKLKKNRHIKINLDNNKYYHYKEDSTIFDYYEIYNKNKEIIPLNGKSLDLDIYMKILKSKMNLIPCIKKYSKDTIKINEKYLNAENLSERDIIPELYEEEDEDIKSLEKSLERSIDKSFDKSYDKWYNSYDKNNDPSSNDLSNSNANESNINNGRNILNKLQEMFIEEVDEENEENEKEEEKKDNLIDDDEEQNGDTIENKEEI